MHIPPYYKLKSWQRFFIGVFTGGVVAYCVFVFMYGSMYEKLYENNLELESEMSDLKSKNESLNKNINEKSKEHLSIDQIVITIINEEELRLDRLIVHQLENLIKKEINHIIGQDINIVSESDELLQSTIENKAFSIDDFTYYFEVKKLTISYTVKLTLTGRLSS